MNTNKIVGHRLAANLKPGDGVNVLTNEGQSSVIVDAVSHTSTSAYIFGTAVGGALMGDPVVFPLPIAYNCPLTYMVA